MDFLALVGGVAFAVVGEGGLCLVNVVLLVGVCVVMERDAGRSFPVCGGGRGGVSGTAGISTGGDVGLWRRAVKKGWVEEGRRAPGWASLNRPSPPLLSSVGGVAVAVVVAVALAAAGCSAAALAVAFVLLLWCGVSVAAVVVVLRWAQSLLLKS